MVNHEYNVHIHQNFPEEFNPVDWTRCPACKALIFTEQINDFDPEYTLFECTHCTRKLIAYREGEHVFFILASPDKIKRMARG